MTNYKSKRKGFTMLELLIAVAIVAILAAVAIPSYLQYTKKAQFSEVVSAADNLKQAVVGCINANQGATNCAPGSYGIPANLGAIDNTNIASVKVDAGVITATAGTDNGLNSETYILTPKYDAAKGVTWVATGTACGDEVNC